MKRIVLLLTLTFFLSSATTATACTALLPKGTNFPPCGDVVTPDLLAPGVVQNRGGGTGSLVVSLILMIYGF
jgi:hypothetical protein